MRNDKVFLIGQVWSQDGKETVRECLEDNYDEVGGLLS